MKKNRIIMTAAIMAAMFTACGEIDKSADYNYLNSENVSKFDDQYEFEEFDEIDDVFAEKSFSANDNIIEHKKSKNTIPDVTKAAEIETTTEILPEITEETEVAAETEPAVSESEYIEENLEEIRYITLIDAPYISQDSYPTGCELVSTSMLLKYYGFEVSAIELADKGYMQLVPLEKADDGRIYCANPHEAFIGDPHRNDGFGCYSGAIINGLSAYLADYCFDVANLSGITLNDLCVEYIDFGEPVLIWATINMKASVKNPQNTWIIKESGEEFSWLSNEHCLLLIGYDDENFYFHDPQRGAAVAYNRDTAQKRYEELGCQAVTIRPW